MFKKLRFNYGMIPSLALTVAAAMGMTACEEDDDIIFPQPNPVIASVAVFPDTTYDFSHLITFAMPDTVVHVYPLTGTPLEVSRAHDRAILDRVRANLLARGYIEQTRADSIRPDFVMLVTATATENQVAFGNYPWFAFWGFFNGFNWFVPGFDDSWGIEYPSHPIANVADFPRATLLVDLIPTLQINPLSKTIQSTWTGVATALMNSAVTDADVEAAIDQMFILSPYLSAPQVNPL